MQVTTVYPGDAAAGGDYIAGGRSQQPIYDDPNEPGRQERIIVTDRLIDMEGRLCVGELTVRAMAAMLGMYEGERVNRIIERDQALDAELGQTRDMLERCQAALDEARAEVTMRFFASDGKEYATAEAARQMSIPVEAPQLVNTEDQETAAAKIGALEAALKDAQDRQSATDQALSDANARVTMLESTALEHAQTIDAISTQRDGALERLAIVSDAENPDTAVADAKAYFDQLNAAQATADAAAAAAAAPPADPAPAPSGEGSTAAGDGAVDAGPVAASDPSTPAPADPAPADPAPATDAPPEVVTPPADTAPAEDTGAGSSAGEQPSAVAPTEPPAGDTPPPVGEVGTPDPAAGDGNANPDAAPADAAPTA